MKTLQIYPLLLLTLIFVSLSGAVSTLAAEIDERIESSAKQSYVFKTYLNKENIVIHSVDGVVTLTGKVSDDVLGALAQETVANISGVKTVDNQLESETQVVTTDPNAALSNQVRSALLLRQAISTASIEVSANNGFITLQGVAGNIAQKDLITEYTMDVQGVTQVNNEMTVATVAAEAADEARNAKEDDISSIEAESTAGPAKTNTLREKMDIIVEWVDDASVTALVKTTLLSHRSTSSLKTTVTTIDGVVTLGGNAKSAAEKDLADKIVNDVRGVKGVINQMTIGPDAT